MIISVIGAGQATSEIAALAEEVGRELAKRGAAIVCGGLGGVMEAACRGAKSRRRDHHRGTALERPGGRQPVGGFPHLYRTGLRP